MINFLKELLNFYQMLNKITKKYLINLYKKKHGY